MRQQVDIIQQCQLQLVQVEQLKQLATTLQDDLTVLRLTHPDDSFEVLQLSTHIQTVRALINQLTASCL